MADVYTIHSSLKAWLQGDKRRWTNTRWWQRGPRSLAAAQRHPPKPLAQIWTGPKEQKMRNWCETSACKPHSGLVTICTWRPGAHAPSSFSPAAMCSGWDWPKPVISLIFLRIALVISQQFPTSIHQKIKDIYFKSETWQENLTPLSPFIFPLGGIR